MANAVKLRPSGAPVWVPCPGAPSLWASIPDDETDVAREGTAAHWLGEQILTGAHSGDELIDRQAENGVFITADMLDHLQGYLRLVPGVVDHPRIEHTHLSSIPRVASGTTDADGRTRNDPWCHAIIDLKYGWRIVEPFENWQLMTYAHQIFHEMTPGGSITHFEFIIYQPRASHPEGPVRRWKMSVEELQRNYWPRIERAAQGGDLFTGPHCRDCRATGTCPALRTAAASAAQFSASPILEIYNGYELATELAMLEAAEQHINARSEAIRDMATMRAVEKSNAIPGWTIDRSVGGKKWNTGIDLATIERLTGVVLHKPKQLTPRQAESAGLSPEIIAQYSGRSVGAPKLVKHNAASIMRKMKQKEGN